MVMTAIVLTAGQGMTAEVPARKYIVRPGDTLWDICGREYGDCTVWPRILSANPGLADPHLIVPGRTIVLPTLSGVVTVPATAPVLQEPVAPSAAPAERGPFTVRLLFTNNSNGKLVFCNCPNDPFGGLAERVAFIREYRAANDNVLLVDSGGYLGLSPAKEKARMVMTLMGQMGYDAVGVGDQELFNSLKTYLDISSGSSDMLVNAVILDSSGAPVFAPYRIVTVNGIKLALVGIASENDTFRFFPDDKRDFRVADLDSILARLLPELQETADAVVLLSQLGANGDRAFAERTGGIDLIVGGHSQTLIEKAERVNGAMIVQAGKGGGRVGEVVMTFGDDHRLEGMTYRLYEIDIERYPIPGDILTMIE